MTATPRVVLVTPTYDRTRHDGSGSAIRFAARRTPTMALGNADSLMDRNFNFLWCKALEEADAGRATHMAMLHADIEPEEYWLDSLMDVMAAKGADVVSAVVPLKDFSGLTSTAISDPADPWRIERRLTLHEVHAVLPESFGVEVCPGRKLLVNNGLMLIDLSGDWCQKVCFSTENRIVRFESGGVVKRVVQCVPQDWQFSRDAQDRGGVVVATRRVKLLHHGSLGFGNNLVYGEPFDRECAAGPLEVAAPAFGGAALSTRVAPEG